MNVLVTGGAGYIGSVLVPVLLDRGYYVTILDRFTYGATLGGVVANARLMLVRGDVRDRDLVRDLVRPAHAVVPLAALVGAPLCAEREEEAWAVNYDAISHLVSWLRPEQRIVFPNTNSGYGTTGSEACTEETPLNPISVYGRSKARAEEIVLRHPNAVVFRLATLFGWSPRMRTDLLVNDFTLRAVRDGVIPLFNPHARRNFIHVRDVAQTFADAVEDQPLVGRVYNVGDSRANLTKLQLIEAIAGHVPVAAPIVVGDDPDRRDYLVSNAKLEAIGWRPHHSLDDGIAELVRGYSAFPPPNPWGNV